MENRISLAKSIFLEIDDNSYLREIHESLLVRYAQFRMKRMGFFLEDVNVEGMDIFKVKDDALRFADLLSLSYGVANSDRYKTIAQEIVLLLSEMYPEDVDVKVTLQTVFRNTGNISNLRIVDTKHNDIPLSMSMAAETDKAILKIPTRSDDYFLWQQKAIYEKFNSKTFSYSGPTSLGKTFMMKLYVKQKILDGAGCNFAILVPTRVLIREVSEDIISEVDEDLSSNGYRVETMAGQFRQESGKNYVFVVTPERLMYILMSNPEMRIDHLFIDEAEEMTSGSRATYYFKVISMVMSRDLEASIVFSAPYVPNPSVFLDATSLQRKRAAVPFNTEYSPVNQMCVIVHSSSGRVRVFDNFTKKIIDSCQLKLGGASNQALFSLLSQVAGQSLVYCNSTEAAPELALSFSKAIGRKWVDAELEEFAEELRSYVHEDYALAEVVQHGVAYHFGNLPSYIRRKLEKLFRQGKIKTMFCTSTLLEGVNLPANNLFIVSHRKYKGNLTELDLRNLIGRVGRTKIVLNGTVFIIVDDENEERTYHRLLTNPVPSQKLAASPQVDLDGETKRKIVECLKREDASLDGEEFKNVEIARRYALILLKDIIDGRDSLVVNQFSELLDAYTLAQLRMLYQDGDLVPDDDINISPGQSARLRHAILHEGLRFPPANASSSELTVFLERLCEVFDWDSHEAKFANSINENGTHGSLAYYAFMLRRWTYGYTLNEIIKSRIEYISNIRKTIRIRGRDVLFDRSDRTHVNVVINNVVYTIEQDLLYTLACYFMRFASEYRRLRPDEQFADWYEFLEYGTLDGDAMYLQSLGFSRDCAFRILKLEGLFDRKSRKLNVNSVLARTQKAISEEIDIVRKNHPEVVKI